VLRWPARGRPVDRPDGSSRPSVLAVGALGGSGQPQRRSPTGTLAGGSARGKENQAGRCPPASGVSGKPAERPRPYSRNLCPQLAAAIAYRVLFSLFPLAIFLVSIFGLLIENDDRRNEIVTWAVDHLRLSPDGSVRLE
jgi:Virulence factor BrkB